MRDSLGLSLPFLCISPVREDAHRSKQKNAHTHTIDKNEIFDWHAIQLKPNSCNKGIFKSISMSCRPVCVFCYFIKSSRLFLSPALYFTALFFWAAGRVRLTEKLLQKKDEMSQLVARHTDSGDKKMTNYLLHCWTGACIFNTECREMKDF